MSSSNCCFLTCIQISQEAGEVEWYSHLFKNFPQFVVIHTVKGFGIVNKAEVDFFSPWNSLAFSMIQLMLAIWSLVPLPSFVGLLNVVAPWSLRLLWLSLWSHLPQWVSSFITYRELANVHLHACFLWVLVTAFSQMFHKSLKVNRYEAELVPPQVCSTSRLFLLWWRFLYSPDPIH